MLVSAPTGSGKTLAAFLYASTRSCGEGLAGGLAAGRAVLYVSPLRALGNDIDEEPARRRSRSSAPPRSPRGSRRPSCAWRSAPATPPPPRARRPCSAGRRTSSSPPRSRSTSCSPASAGGRTLGGVETVDRATRSTRSPRDKRGAHLALSLERLEALARRRPQRIGLSATVEPDRRRWRASSSAPGASSRAGRPALRRSSRWGAGAPLDLAIEIPRDELSSVASKELWAETYDRVAEIVRAHRSTLVFVKTRRLAERAAHALAERLGEGAVAAHHGSLSRARRLDAEERLKAGALRGGGGDRLARARHRRGRGGLVVQLGSPGALATGAPARSAAPAHVAGRRRRRGASSR